MNKKNGTALVLILIAVVMTYGQQREIIRGQVLYRGNFVVNENVINVVTEEVTITDEGGSFAIPVMVGDRLVFSAVNYQLKVVEITPEILQNRRLVVEVVEKVQELQEVVVTPEDQEKFLEVRNEEFKGFEYEIDRQTRVQNIALDESVRGMQDGLNFVNIFKALFKSREKEGGTDKEPIKLSDVLRQVYEDRFFVEDLEVPKEQIGAFLAYCDAKIPPRELIRKENEFQLIDFLVVQSTEFRKQYKEEE